MCRSRVIRPPSLSDAVPSAAGFWGWATWSLGLCWAPILGHQWVTKVGDAPTTLGLFHPRKQQKFLNSHQAGPRDYRPICVDHLLCAPGYTHKDLTKQRRTEMSSKEDPGGRVMCAMKRVSGSAERAPTQNLAWVGFKLSLKE